jgi:O-antigen ligase
VLLLTVASQHAHFYRRVLSARLNPYDHPRSAPGHLGLYGFVGRTLHSHPFFGVGLNDFAAFYQPIRRDYGPLSFYVQSLVETGIVGTLIIGAFLGYVFLSLRKSYLLGERHQPADRRGALTVGLTAALVGTMAANAFYLTMTFAYFYVFLILALASPIVFARASRPALVGTDSVRPEVLEARAHISPTA